MNLNLRPYTPWQGTITLKTLDLHAAGEPLRIVTDGFPELPGATILERRRYCREHFDHLRKALMWEPRGHHEMYGCLVTSPVTREADAGVLFLHNEGYSTMCGHGIIALVTALIETGTIEATQQRMPVTLDTPAGLVRATAHLNIDGQVEQVSFINVPSFLYKRDVEIELAGIGRVLLDIAYGGAFYAILPAERLGLRVLPEQTEQLVALGTAIKEAVNASQTIEHPFESELGFLYGTILTDAPENPAHHSRNICVFANAEVDRSPTGTGVSARLALHHAKGELQDHELITIESLLGERSVFQGQVVEETQVGRYSAIVPEVRGQAFVTGRHEFLIDPRDTLGQGFLLR